MILQLAGSLVEELKPIVELLAWSAGLLALIKWLRERRDRATDVLLELENQFLAKATPGRGLVESDVLYGEIRENLYRASVELESSRTGTHRREAPVDDLLRFYIVLCATREAGQLPDRALSVCYRYWLAHYYLADRAEFRWYVNTLFPTLREWLVADCSAWRRFCHRPVSRWWRSFFCPEHFWKPHRLVRSPALLLTRPPTSLPGFDG